jgi:hypothetical protein
MPAAPLTFSWDQLDGAQTSAARKHQSHWAQHGSGPSVGPLGWGEPSDTSSRPLSCRAQSPAAGATMTLQRRGAAMTRMSLTCYSNQPPRWRDITAPRRLGRRVLIGGDAQLPCLPPLGTVVVVSVRNMVPTLTSR